MLKVIYCIEVKTVIKLCFSATACQRFNLIIVSWKPAWHLLISIQFNINGGLRFPIPERRDAHKHIEKQQQPPPTPLPTQTISQEHRGCYLCRIFQHKGTFIGLPSICRVQEQS